MLDSVQSAWLVLDNTVLNETETRALVTAMRDRVERVALGGEVTLDIEELSEYDGGGTCGGLGVVGETRRRYEARLRSRILSGWSVSLNDMFALVIERN